MSKEHKTTLAMIERGDIQTEYGGKYTVRSLDRDGVFTPPLKKMNENEIYVPGDLVYFFVFGDGTGMIIGKILD